MLLFCLWISRLCLLLSLSKSRVYEIWYSCNILFTCLCKLFEGLFCLSPFLKSRFCWICLLLILEDPGADSGGKGKSIRVEKHGTKKSKERREEPLGTMSDQTSSKRSPPFCLMIRQKNTKVFLHQSEVRMGATVWNWFGKTLSPGALLAVVYFSSCHIFSPPLSASGSSRMSKRQIQQNLDFKKG